MGYEPNFFMGYTKKGEVRHLTQNGHETLCGRYKIHHLITSLDTAMPVPFRDHWLGLQDEDCSNCLHEREQILKPLAFEKKQRRLI